MYASILIAIATLAADPKDELDKFRGNWVMTAGHVDGKAVADDNVKKNRITWDGDKIVIVSPHQNPEPIKAKITKITPKGKGGQMEWKRENGPGSDVTMLAIYEWDGPDAYKIAFDPKGKARPTTTEPKEGQIVHVWKREKK